EMSGRVTLLADAIKHGFGTTSTRDLMAALVASLPPPLQTSDETTGQGHRLWPYGELIARHGLDDIDASFGAMIELTQRFTSEFAVRPFLALDVDGILGRMEALIPHPNAHVRRWLSEGTRTRLPWGRGVPALRTRQDRRLALLSRLRHDPERYVQRSVANHLGDIFKDDLGAALSTVRAWLAEDHESLTWICRHAARAPLKSGHPEVLSLFGHAPSGVVADTFSVTPKGITVGDTVTLGATLRHTGHEPTTTRVDYALLRPSKTAKPSRKVFRWADRALDPGESLTLETRYTFVPRTIRPVHPGPHTFELIIDGELAGTADLTVT
ncbi:MAG TPA: hypothetical protein PK095_06190, partial [Myxococcota bacterium]|nr:hypothetical protein [Myxococcota bacterium]